MSRPQDAIPKLSRGESVEVAQKDGESASGEALPEGWALTELGNVSEFVMGQAPPKAETNFDGKGTVFVKAGEFGKPRPIVREWTTKPLKLAKATDVLICVVGATCGKLNLGIDAAIGRSVAAIRPDADALDQEYLYAFLKRKVQELRSSSTGSAQGVISKTQLNDIGLPLAPRAEQSRIVSAIESLQERSSRARVLLSEVGPLIGQLRQSVLRDAFSGKLTADWRAEHLNVQPASELLSQVHEHDDGTKKRRRIKKKGTVPIVFGPTFAGRR